MRRPLRQGSGEFSTRDTHKLEILCCRIRERRVLTGAAPLPRPIFGMSRLLIHMFWALADS